MGFQVVLLAHAAVHDAEDLRQLLDPNGRWEATAVYWEEGAWRAGEGAGGGVVGFLSLLIVVSSVVKVELTLCWEMVSSCIVQVQHV